MKIKRTLEMDLLELLTWAKENDKTGDFYGVEEGYRVFISKHHGWVQTDNGEKIPTFDTMFRVEQDVEINETTSINMMTVINNNETESYKQTSISDLLSEEDDLRENYHLKYVYLQHEDGTIGELIWT